MLRDRGGTRRARSDALRGGLHQGHAGCRQGPSALGQVPGAEKSA